MPVHITCPHCQAPASLPDGTSGTSECPACKRSFTVCLPGLPPPPQRVILEGLFALKLAAWVFVVVTLIESAMFLFFVLRSFRGF